MYRKKVAAYIIILLLDPSSYPTDLTLCKVLTQEVNLQVCFKQEDLLPKCGSALHHMVRVFGHQTIHPMWPKLGYPSIFMGFPRNSVVKLQHISTFWTESFQLATTFQGRPFFNSSMTVPQKDRFITTLCVDALVWPAESPDLISILLNTFQMNWNANYEPCSFLQHLQRDLFT